MHLEIKLNVSYLSKKKSHTQFCCYLKAGILTEANRENSPAVSNHFPRNRWYRIGPMLLPDFRFAVFYSLQQICITNYKHKKHNLEMLSL